MTVSGEEVASIGPGLLVLLGVTHDDDEATADRLADKVRALRVFPDADGRMNEPLGDREVLVRQPVHAATATRARATGRATSPRRGPSTPSRSTSASATASARKRGVFGATMEVGARQRRPGDPPARALT